MSGSLLEVVGFHNNIALPTLMVGFMMKIQ
jgi:hypothetical protein